MQSKYVQLAIRSWLSTLSFFLLALNIIGQKPSYVGHIGSEDGLVSQLCQHLIEDDLGNLWISSFQDIQKYNGHSVSVFPASKFTGDREGIMDLFKDKNGNVWAIQGSEYGAKPDTLYFKKTRNYNLNIINPISDKVISFKDYTNQIELREEDIISIHSVNEVLFFITKDKQVYSFMNELVLHGVINDLKSFLTVDASYNFIHYEKNGINSYDKEGHLISAIDSTALAGIKAITLSDVGQLYLLEPDEEEVKIKEIINNRIVDFRTIDRKYFDTGRLSWTKVLKYKDGSLLVNDKFFYKNDTGKLVLKSSNRDNSIFDYVIGKSGLSFIATNLGVYVLENKKSLFSQFASSEVQGVNSVRGIYRDHRIDAYRNSEGKEVIESENVNLSFLDGKNLGSLASMHYLDPQNKNHLWSVGYIPGKISKIDLQEKTYKNFDLDLDVILVNNLHRSSFTNEIYAASLSGLHRLNPASNEYKKIEAGSLGEKKLNINQIVEFENKLWLATSSGLIVYNEKDNTSQFIPIRVDSTLHEVQYIHVDKRSEGTLWLAAKRGGLVKWHVGDDKYDVINTEDGLSNNDTHAILEDSQERLWISTNRYLNCLDKKSGDISIFTEHDGISHSEFNRFSYFHDTIQNHMYFGGLNGYTYFNPDSINTTKTENKIKLKLIDAIKTNEDASTENIYVKTQGSNSIDFNDQNVSLQLYLATNYLANTKQRQYSYRIPGLLDKWKTQSTNEIKLNRLPYGDYKIELISDLNKPAFTSDILTLDLQVIQPFYKTILFKIIALLIFLYVLWLAVQRYLQNIKDRNINLEKLISERTNELQELNELKTKIFAILSHDLRNPISNLSNITEKIKFLSRHNRLDEIDLLASQTKGRLNALNDNLNNILLWATSENNLLVQDPQKYSIHLEIKKILSLYENEIEDKQMTTKIDIDPLDQVYVDISILQTILRNYINNAIKFSYQQGQLNFSKGSETKDRLVIKVEDNGIGIAEPSIKETAVAEKIRRAGKGSGIGMRICTELALKADINIDMKSNPKGGTIIEIDLPKR